MNTQLSELLRLLTNLIRIGTISEVDTENGLCRVQTGGLETAPNRAVTTITKRNKSTRPLILNGSPSPEQNMGLPGIMGAFAVYDRVLTAAEQTDKRDKLKTIMSLRGEFVN